MIGAIQYLLAHSHLKILMFFLNNVFRKFQVLGLLLNRQPLLFTTSGDGKIFFRFSGRMMCVKIYFGLYASIEHFSTSSAMNYSLELKFMKLCKSKIDVEL